jgi:hypothetical protein
MPELLFDPLYGWNLVEELTGAGVMPDTPPNSYAGHMRLKAHERGWITAESRQSARSMLVYADRVLLPGEFDIPLSQSLRADKHVDWWSSANDELNRARWRLKQARYRYPEIRALGPLILARRSRGEEREFERLLRWWEDLARWEADARRQMSDETWQIVDNARGNSPLRDVVLAAADPASADRLRALLAADPLTLEEEFAPIEERFRSDIDLVTQSALVAAHGIPTLHSYSRPSRSPPPQADQLRIEPEAMAAASAASASLGVVSFYFRNVVRCPAPETVKEALNLRDNGSVVAWREQIAGWTAQLCTGKIKLDDIKQQIDEANGYIEGASFVSRMLPRFTPFVTLPLAAAAEFFHLSQLAWCLISFEAVKLAYAEILPEAVEGPERLQHKWLMLSSDAVPKGRGRKRH